MTNNPTAVASGRVKPKGVLRPPRPASAPLMPTSALPGAPFPRMRAGQEE